MIRLFPFVTVAIVACAARGQLVNPANGHAYVLTPTLSTWSDAEAYAESIGGYLATVRNSAEQQWFIDNVLVGDNAFSGFWIGLRRTEGGGPFSWVSGDPVSFTDWHPGEPNNACGGEPCTVMNWYTSEGIANSTGDWNDTANGGVHFNRCDTAGSVYYRGIVELPCRADFNLDGFVDFFDFNDFVTCFEGGACPPGRSADFNGDGFADFFDFNDFITAFETGC